MLQDFKKFAVKGNVMELAIGVIIGGSFGKIVSSLVTDIIMPPIGLLTGGVDFKHLALTLHEATDTTPAVMVNYGVFMNTVIDFLIISFTIFLVVRQFNRLKKKEEIKADEPSEEVLILREIRDVLKKRK